MPSKMGSTLNENKLLPWEPNVFVKSIEPNEDRRQKGIVTEFFTLKVYPFTSTCYNSGVFFVFFFFVFLFFCFVFAYI